MNGFNKLSYLEQELQELEYLELRTKPLKGYIPYDLFFRIQHIKINIRELLEVI